MREARALMRATVIMTMAMALTAGGLHAQENPVWSGHAAFGSGRYDDALAAYRSARARGARVDSEGKDWLPELIETVERRRTLGVIAPPDTHRVGVIFVTMIRTVRGDGSTRERPDVTAAQRETWQTWLGMLRQVLETFSGGGWTLRFDSVDAISTWPDGHALSPWNPDLLDLDGYFRAHADTHDSYITLSNSVSPALGLARRYPLVNGVAYGPHRGMVGINAGNHDFTVLLHEFFHIVEWVSNTEPAHAYRDALRQSFPGWRGVTEFDYYRWHFETRLAPNWSRLQHRTRWRLLPGHEAAGARLAAANERIAWQDRLAARMLADSLQRAGIDSASARRIQARILELSPWNSVALRAADRAERWRGPPAAHAFADRVALLRDAEDFVTVADYAAMGSVIGGWRPPQMRREGTELEWDASDALGGAGSYDVTMWYTDGRTAARIAWVALLEDGREIARDTHDGVSGTRRDAFVYTLALPARRPGARYAVRAGIAGMNGTDSNGLVLVRRH